EVVADDGGLQPAAVRDLHRAEHEHAPGGVHVVLQRVHEHVPAGGGQRHVVDGHREQRLLGRVDHVDAQQPGGAGRGGGGGVLQVVGADLTARADGAGDRIGLDLEPFDLLDVGQLELAARR